MGANPPMSAATRWRAMRTRSVRRVDDNPIHIHMAFRIPMQEYRETKGSAYVLLDFLPSDLPSL